MGNVNQIVVCQHFNDIDELAGFLDSPIGHDQDIGQKAASIHSFQIVPTLRGFSLVAVPNAVKSDWLE